MAKKNRHRGRFDYDRTTNKNKGIPMPHEDEEKKAWIKLVGRDMVKGVKKCLNI